MTLPNKKHALKRQGNYLAMTVLFSISTFGCKGGIEVKASLNRSCKTGDTRTNCTKALEGIDTIDEVAIPPPDTTLSPAFDLLLSNLPGTYSNISTLEIKVSSVSHKYYLYVLTNQKNDCSSATGYSVPHLLTAAISLRTDDGAYRLCVKAWTGSESPPGYASHDFNIDTEAPSLSISTAPAPTFRSSVRLDGTCEFGLPLQLAAGGFNDAAPTLVCPVSGFFSDDVALSDGYGTKSLTLSQTDRAGNTASVTREFEYREAPALSGLTMPFQYMGNISNDPKERHIVFSQLKTGEFVSLQILEDHIAAVDLSCNNFEPGAKVTGGGTILLDLIGRSTAGTINLNCQTAKGSLTVTASYQATRYSSISSARYSNAAFSFSQTKFGYPRIIQSTISPDGKWHIWLAEESGIFSGKSVLFGQKLADGKIYILTSNDGTIATSASGRLTGIPTIAPDSSFVLFAHDAPEYNDANNSFQIIKKSLLDPTQPPVRVSVASDGATKADGGCDGPVVSPDSTYALMTCYNSTNMGSPGTGGMRQVIKKSLTNLATPPVTISVSGDGTTRGNNNSFGMKISPDGTYVYFLTNASNLGVTNGKNLIVRKNMLNLATPPVVMSVTSNGTTLANDSVSGNDFIIAPDGNSIVFASKASNLGVTGAVIQTIRKSISNLATAPEILSVGADGTTQADGDTSPIFIDPVANQVVLLSSANNLGGNKGNGRLLLKKSLAQPASPLAIVYQSDSSHFWPANYYQRSDANGVWEYFYTGFDDFSNLSGIRRRLINSTSGVEPGPTELILSDDFAAATNLWNFPQFSKFSRDRSFVVFSTDSVFFGATTSNVQQLVVQSLTDRTSNLRLVSVGADGTTIGNNNSTEPVISRDGSFLLFVTSASNFGGSVASTQIVRKSLTNLNSPVELISVTADGTTAGSGPSISPEISADGTFALFATRAANLGATGGVNYQIVKKSLIDLATPPVVISVLTDGTTVGNGLSVNPVISADSSFTIFTSRAANLGATGGVSFQIIKKSLTNLASPPQVVSVTADGITIGNGTSWENNLIKPSLSADGSMVIFSSKAANLGATGGVFYQIIKKSLTDLATPPVVLSVAADGTTIADQNASTPLLAADGSFAIFLSKAPSLGVTTVHDQLIKKSIANPLSAPEIISKGLLAGSQADRQVYKVGDLSADSKAVLMVTHATNLGFSANGMAQLYQLNLAE